MSYTKTNWQNLPNTTTPINATNLNKIENELSKTDTIVGGSAYDSTQTYAVGDFCIYNDTLYRCTTAISTAEAWNSSHWTATSVEEELDALRKSGGIPTNSVIGYDGSTIPSGFEETFGPNDYSTTEKVIGTYLGKPLYRIVVDYTTANDTTNFNNIIEIPNVDRLFIKSFFYEVAFSDFTEKYVNNYQAFSFYYTTLNGDNHLKEKHTSSYANSRPAQVIVEYTKTTD